MTRAEDEAKAKEAEAKKEADAKARRDQAQAGKASDSSGKVYGGATADERATFEPMTAADDPTPSLPDRWEVGQTEAEADANAAIATKRAEDAKAEDERKATESADARDGTLSEDERKARADDATNEAQKTNPILHPEAEDQRPRR
jgi:hypothetical protein